MRMEGSCAEGELGVAEQGKEGARGCGQTEGEADVEATTLWLVNGVMLTDLDTFTLTTFKQSG